MSGRFETDEDDPLADYDPDDFGFTGGARRKREPDKGYVIKDVVVLRSTDAAILVRGSGLSSDPFGVEDAAEEAWIPKSQVHDGSDVTAEAQDNDRGDLTVSTWFAKKRGLV